MPAHKVQQATGKMKLKVVKERPTSGLSQEALGNLSQSRQFSFTVLTKSLIL